MALYVVKHKGHLVIRAEPPVHCERLLSLGPRAVRTVKCRVRARRSDITVFVPQDLKSEG
jgi:hypothetical protein